MFSHSTVSEGRRLDMSSVKEWAHNAAAAYLNEKIEPTTSLTKLASDEELSPHQVEVVAGEINKEIHRIKFAAAKSQDKYFAADFPLADAKRAIAELQADSGDVKIAAYIPAPIYDKPEHDLFALGGIKLEDNGHEKTAKLKGDSRETLEKTALLLDQLSDKIVMGQAKVDAAEKTFLKQARQYILQNSDSQAGRLKAIEDLTKVAEEVDFPKAKRALAKVAFFLGIEGLLTAGQAKTAAEGLLKKADEEVSEALIDRTLPVKVINGTHPIYVTLKTFQSHSSALDGDLNQRRIVDDKARILAQKVRVL